MPWVRPGRLGLESCLTRFLTVFFADDATLGLAPPDAVPQDNLAALLPTPLRIRMKLPVLKLPPCNEEKEKGDFTR